MNQLDAFREEINAGHMEAIAPLRDYLAERGESRLAMGFEYIERVAWRFIRFPIDNRWRVEGADLPYDSRVWKTKYEAVYYTAQHCAAKLNECCGRLWWKPSDCPCREEQRRLCEAINAAGHDFTEEQILDLADWYATKEWGRMEAIGLYVIMEHVGQPALVRYIQSITGDPAFRDRYNAPNTRVAMVLTSLAHGAARAAFVCVCGWAGFRLQRRPFEKPACPVCGGSEKGIADPREVLAKIGKLHLCTEEH